MPVILELRRVRQENCAFEAILDFSQKRARIMGERPLGDVSVPFLLLWQNTMTQAT